MAPVELEQTIQALRDATAEASEAVVDLRAVLASITTMREALHLASQRERALVETLAEVAEAFHARLHTPSGAPVPFASCPLPRCRRIRQLVSACSSQATC